MAACGWRYADGGVWLAASEWRQVNGSEGIAAGGLPRMTGSAWQCGKGMAVCG